MLRRRGLMTQLPSAVARALAMRTNLILIDLLGKLAAVILDLECVCGHHT